MKKAIIYHNPMWSKSRESVKILSENNILFNEITYLKNGISINEIESILTMLNLKAKDIIRTGDSRFKELNIDIDNEIEAKNAISANPRILQRPIIIYNNKCVIGRPPEKILEIL